MIPVVFFHLGRADVVVEKVLNQAKKKNKVILIGDDGTKGLASSCEIDFVDYRELVCDQFSKFEENYEHLSTNPYGVELLCFLRWFAVRNLMKKINCDRIFYADSDVLLYCDVTEENEKYEQFDMAIVHRCCGSTAYMSKNSLNTFCDYVTNIYSDKNSFEYDQLRSKYITMRNHNKDGGVCDMTLLEAFHYSDVSGGGPCRIGEMTHVIGDSTFDHNINVDDGVYDHNGRYKNIVFENGIPYCHHKNLNRLVKFNALHFQGPAKLLIRDNQIGNQSNG